MPRPLLLAALLFASFAAAAGDPAPEIRRSPAAAQAVGIDHTLRVIPEACARLQGRFTGQASTPYAFTAARTSPRCQPRARLVDATRANASVAAGWVLNDVIRVPEAACPTRQAVVRVWRKGTGNLPPRADAQGRSRIYLKQGVDAARAGDLKPVPLYAAALSLEGRACR